MSKKLAAKASLIQLPPAAGAETFREGAETRAKTAPGTMAHFMASQSAAVKEADELRERLKAFEGADPVLALDASKVRPSRWANRHPASFADAAYAELKAEIASAGGNVQPVSVRRVAGAGEGAEHTHELVYGHRRHRACLELGLPVAAIVEPLTDAELFTEMERENRERQDLSPWEQGQMYKRALDEGVFPSLRKLAAAIGAQAGNVSTAIQLAALPAEVVAAFPSPLALQFRWGAALKAALERNPEGVLAHARELAAVTPRLPAKEVLARLTGVQAAPRRDAPVPLLSGSRVVGSWDRDAKGNVSVQIKAGALSPAREKRLREFLLKLFD